MMATWEQIAKAKRENLSKLIPEKWKLKDPVPSADVLRDVTGSYVQQFLTPREIEITETDAVGIVQHTTTGKWTAVEVTEAFCHRAALAHQLVNCLHEIFFDAAIEQAKELDAYFAKHGRPIGPLHGLPVSLKDQFHVKGVETTMGYVGWVGTFQGIKNDPRAKVFESELVRELRELGAVLHCKTSVPTSLMVGETINNLIGYTWNPTNRHLSSGGSSGGEGALIALRGSPAGFGTDIGGSVRIPSAFNGIYGIRPSAGRIPYEGAANSMDGQNSILSVIGPLATSVRSLKLLFQSVLSTKPWLHDPLAIEIPWRDTVEEEVLSLTKGKGQLAFGILHDDGVVRPQPPVARALRIVEATLKRLGHKIIEWKPPSHLTAGALAEQIYSLDSGADISHHLNLSGEPLPPQVELIHGRDKQKTAQEIAAINVAKREYQKAYLDYWNSTASLTGTGRPVDGFLSPVAPWAAVMPSKYTYILYTLYVNTLDYTSVVFPVTKADKSIDVAPSDYTPLSDADKVVYDNYDPEIYHGAPVGLQLVGRRLQEEKMLALAEYISHELQNDGTARVSL
ncbi:hypothetical protein VTO42DRAFT_281 [Malbranchea cinnamomea]